MIKKIVPLFFVFFLAFGILFVSIQRATVDAKDTQETNTIKFSISPATSSSEAATAAASPSPNEDYFLAYPGLLPDSPLYNLKMVRDRIWIWLTAGNVNKANLFSLYADKRLGAGKALIEGGKASLGIDTLLKGEKYFERAINEVEIAKKNQENVNELTATLKKAVIKHEEVISGLVEKTSSEEKTQLENIFKFVKTLEERLAKI